MLMKSTGPQLRIGFFVYKMKGSMSNVGVELIK